MIYLPFNDCWFTLNSFLLFSQLGLDYDRNIVMSMAEPVCIKDFELLARGSLDDNAWNYYSSGANHQQTLAENTNAYSR